MKWISGIKSKMTAALLLFVVLVLVLLTNFGERNNAVKINKAVSSLYEDRLVVGSYIFDYAQHLQSIGEAAGNPETTFLQKTKAIKTESEKIKQLHLLYLKTVLTPQEKKEFEVFFDLCKNIEKQTLNGEFELVKCTAAKGIGLLKSLSKLQVAEGKTQMANVTSLYTFSNFYSHFELAVLIVIALIIQALVLSSRKRIHASSLPENISMN